MYKRTAFCLVVLIGCTVTAQTVNLGGTVATATGQPVENAIVTLVRQAMTDTTGEDGTYLFSKATAVAVPPIVPQAGAIAINNGVLQFTLSAPAPVTIELFDVKGNLLKKKLGQVQAEKDKLEAALTELKKRYDTLAAKLNYPDEDKTELDLKEIVVQQSPLWQGEILAVDNEYGYAVISLGIKKNLPQNLSLNIFHNQEPIGKAKVLKLYENTSVIKIIDQSKEISEGDSVRNVN